MIQPLSRSKEMRERKPSEPATSVRAEPTRTSLCFAREKATLSRRMSERRLPTWPVALERTKERIMKGLSRPWYRSTVSISTSDVEMEEEEEGGGRRRW
jgi:hypothetical protein